MPQIRKSGKDWIIDMGPHKAAPCLRSEEEAVRLLNLITAWDGKFVHSHVDGKVVNCALLHEKDGTITDLLLVRHNRQSYWIPAKECEVIE